MLNRRSEKKNKLIINKKKIARIIVNKKFLKKIHNWKNKKSKKMKMKLKKIQLLHIQINFKDNKKGKRKKSPKHMDRLKII